MKLSKAQYRALAALCGFATCAAQTSPGLSDDLLSLVQQNLATVDTHRLVDTSYHFKRIHS